MTKEDYDAVMDATEPHHKAKLSHQLIAGAAGYEAMKAYNDHCAKNGKPSNHAKAKEIFAGFAAVAIDHLIETKGLDALDRAQARKHADEYRDKHLGDDY